MGTQVDIDAQLLAREIFTSIPLSEPLQSALVSRLWPCPSRRDPNDIPVRSYLAQIQREFTLAYAGQHAIKTFSELFFILDTIRDNTHMCLAEIKQIILDNNPKCESSTSPLLASSIELAVRLWLLVSVKITMPSHRRLLETSLPWPDNLTLLEVLQRHLTQPPITPSTQVGRFSDYLNVVHMKRIANMRVLWTNNLCEHLAMQGSTLYLFQHVGVLRQITGSPSSAEFLPHHLINETITTLNLLIPHDSPGCNTWLGNEIDTYQLDTDLRYRTGATSRNKADFIYWHDRMSSLSDIFDLAKPSSIPQWWHDRRDMGMWWNYWLVVVGISLTVVFGLVQSVTGLIQVVQNAAGDGAGGS